MAVDPDGDNITYNIPEGTTGSDKFKINNTGDILVKAQLDREAVSTYMITIEARDDVVRQDYPTRTLFIVIEDINDETPNFILGDTRLTIVEVRVTSTSHTRTHTTSRTYTHTHTCACTHTCTHTHTRTHTRTHTHINTHTCTHTHAHTHAHTHTYTHYCILCTSTVT